MSLDNFFSINMPYGIKRNNKNEWFSFNREYMPLGWNSKSNQQSIYDEAAFSQFPIHTKYINISDRDLKQIGGEPDSIHYDSEGKPNMVFLYGDNSNPVYVANCWDKYFEKIKILSLFEI